MRVARLVALGLVLSAAPLACGDDDGAPAGSGTTAAPATGGSAVTIADFAFDPEELEIPAGTSVEWTNTDGEAHSVKSTSDVAFESEDLGQDDTFSFVFDQAGEYEYFCGIHPFMTGTVTVSG